jgi:hypothetical protein
MKAKEAFADMGQNFMTPTVIRYYDLPDGTMVELSSGTGFDNDPIYGVTVLNPDGTQNHDQSRMFHSLGQATTYIAEEL